MTEISNQVPLRLHIGGISSNISVEELNSLFNRVTTDGPVSVDLISDNVTGIRRGFGFVQLSNQTDCDKIRTSFNGVKWKGSKLTVTPAKENFMERLKRDWRCENEVESIEELVKPTPPGLSKLTKKGIPSRVLRIRKKSGDTPILVDPIPKRSNDNSSNNKSKNHRKRVKPEYVVHQSQQLLEFEDDSVIPPKSLNKIWKDETEEADSAAVIYDDKPNLSEHFNVKKSDDDIETELKFVWSDDDEDGEKSTVSDDLNLVETFHNKIAPANSNSDDEKSMDFIQDTEDIEQTSSELVQIEKKLPDQKHSVLSSDEEGDDGSFFDYEAETACQNAKKSTGFSSDIVDFEAENKHSMAVLSSIIDVEPRILNENSISTPVSRGFVPQLRFDPMLFSEPNLQPLKNEKKIDSKFIVPEHERFSANIPNLVDIFTVNDKATSKMSTDEKEKAKGFKISSLFEEELPDIEENSEPIKFTKPALVSKDVVLKKQDRKAEKVRNQSKTDKNESKESDVCLIWRDLNEIREKAKLFCRQEDGKKITEQWELYRSGLKSEFKTKHREAVKSRNVTPAQYPRGQK